MPQVLRHPRPSPEPPESDEAPDRDPDRAKLTPNCIRNVDNIDDNDDERPLSSPRPLFRLSENDTERLRSAIPAMDSLQCPHYPRERASRDGEQVGGGRWVVCWKRSSGGPCFAFVDVWRHDVRSAATLDRRIVVVDGRAVRRRFCLYSSIVRTSTTEQLFVEFRSSASSLFMIAYSTSLVCILPPSPHSHYLGRPPPLLCRLRLQI